MALGFEHPFTCTLAGPTKCGKTSWVEKLLQALPYYICPSPTRVVWAYGVENQDQIKRIGEKSLVPVEFVEGLPDMSIFSTKEANLLIVDDLMFDAGRSNVIADLFTKGAHHRNVSIILMLQNLYHQGRKMRDIHTSTNYIVLFNNPRDKTQIKHLARQAFPDNPNFLLQAYKQACSRPFGYLVIDFSQSTPDSDRVCTGIFPPEVLQKFVPVK